MLGDGFFNVRHGLNVRAGSKAAAIRMLGVVDTNSLAHAKFIALGQVRCIPLASAAAAVWSSAPRSSDPSGKAPAAFALKVVVDLRLNANPHGLPGQFQRQPVAVQAGISEEVELAIES